MANGRKTAHERWGELLRKRREPGADQAVLGPREHGAYAELRVLQNPIVGTLEQMMAVPAYTAAKALGVVSGRSPPSLDELAEGYKGIGRGLEGNIKRAQSWARDLARASKDPEVTMALDRYKRQSLYTRFYGKGTIEETVP